MPWSASSGAQKIASERPATRRAAAVSERKAAPLFRNDVLKACPGKDRKDQVVESEEGQVPARVVRDSRADSADDERYRHRQEEQRQEELTRTGGGCHRAEKGPDGGDPHVRERDAGDELPGHVLVEERERRQRDCLGEQQEREHAERLTEPDRAAVARSEDQPVERPLIPLADERAYEREQRGEEEGDPEHPARREAGALGGEGEVEHHERRDDEQQHGRHGVARPQLDEEILPREGGDVAEVAGHASASRWVACGAMRSG